jgi:trans-aconitate methyltransferase
MNDDKPFAPSCERNQQVIGDVLAMVIEDRPIRVLEMGSGTGQHAVYLAERLPNLIWHTSDLAVNHPGIRQWLDESGLRNVRPPIQYEAGVDDWPAVRVDLVFTANTLHIMAEAQVEQWTRHLGRYLKPGNMVMIYGPFKYHGQFTTPSNAEFDQWLKDADPRRGIRDFERLNQWMTQRGLQLVVDISMPANNQILLYERS